MSPDIAPRITDPMTSGDPMRSPVIDASKLTGITLKKGGHSSPDRGLCLLEAVAFVAGERHSDRPECVSTVLGEFGRSLNDVLPDDRRQELLPLVLELPGTRDDGLDEQRSYLALDWLIRTWLPTWLELTPACRGAAAKVRELGRIVDLVSAERAGPVVRAAQDEARAARSAAWAAAWAAAGDAAWAAAWAAAGDAAGDAAWAAAWAAAGDAAWAAARAAAGAAAGAAAWAAAWAAAGDAAGDAAGAAAGAAAGDAAWAAARAAAGAAAGAAARAAARAAAGDALAPTVTELQKSAVELFGTMIRPEPAA